MRTKVAVTLDSRVLDHIDELVASERCPSRSHAIESAVIDKLKRIQHTRLARECAKLNRRDEQALADEGLAAHIETRGQTRS
jgi:metal-responsive CopG/Arc/MetJ family transcriptional regulator